MDKKGELLEAPDDFCLSISYNPGYQSVLKDLKQSTRQRFVALEFDYPAPSLEQKIIVTESGIDGDTAARLTKFAGMTRNLKGNGLDEGASTRLLVHAGKLIAGGIEPLSACRACVSEALTDDPEMLAAVKELNRSSRSWFLIPWENSFPCTASAILPLSAAALLKLGAITFLSLLVMVSLYFLAHTLKILRILARICLKTTAVS